MIEALFPSLTVAVLVGMFTIARFENQRWVRAQLLRGMYGSSIITGFFVEFTAFASMVFGLAFLVSFGFQHSWAASVGLLLISFGVPMVYVVLFSHDSWVAWMVATLVIWPLVIALTFQTTWFGLLR